MIYSIARGFYMGSIYQTIAAGMANATDKLISALSRTLTHIGRSWRVGNDYGIARSIYDLAGFDCVANRCQTCHMPYSQA